MFVRKVVCSVAIPLAGIAARCTTAPAPARHPTAWPNWVKSTARPAFPLAPVTTTFIAV